MTSFMDIFFQLINFQYFSKIAQKLSSRYAAGKGYYYL